MRSRVCLSGGVVLILAALAAPCLAQESQSANLAAQLRQLLSEHRLDMVAAVVPDQPDRFVAASLVPRIGLLVISARSSSPAFVADCIRRREYKDAYSYLNGTSLADGKVFIQDVGADGLRPRRQADGAAFDITYENVTRQVMFDGDPIRQHMTEAQYLTAFKALDAQYAKMLALLIEELKKGA